MSALIEKDLEDSFAALVATALEETDHVAIRTSWSQEVDAVKGEDDPADEIVVSIVAGAPSYDTYAGPVCEIPLALSIAVRQECYPTGEALAAVMAPLSEVLLRLQLCDSEVVHSALSGDNFRADGFQMHGGDALVNDTSRRCWTVNRAFTVRGIASLPTTTTTTT